MTEVTEVVTNDEIVRVVKDIMPVFAAAQETHGMPATLAGIICLEWITAKMLGVSTDELEAFRAQTNEMLLEQIVKEIAFRETLKST